MKRGFLKHEMWITGNSCGNVKRGMWIVDWMMWKVKKMQVKMWKLYSKMWIYEIQNIYCFGKGC